MSGILFSGPPGRILDAWRDDRLRLVMSPEIVDEYVRVAERLSKQYRAVDVESILALVVQKAEVVPSVPLPQPVCDTPTTTSSSLVRWRLRQPWSSVATGSSAPYPVTKA